MIPRRGAEIPVTKRRVEAKKCLVEPVSLELVAPSGAYLHGTWS